MPVFAQEQTGHGQMKLTVFLRLLARVTVSGIGTFYRALWKLRFIKSIGLRKGIVVKKEVYACSLVTSLSLSLVLFWE